MRLGREQSIGVVDEPVSEPDIGDALTAVCTAHSDRAGSADVAVRPVPEGTPIPSH